MLLRKMEGIIGGAGLLLAIGAGGGIEQDTMAWGSGLLCIVLGFTAVFASLYLARRTR